MKKLFLITGLYFLIAFATGQRISQVTISNNSNSNIISFLVDETVILNITVDGKISNWGIESIFRRQYDYNQKLDKYMGKEEYYPETANEASRGKIKYIGRTSFTYYTSDENEKWAGKLKTIGPFLIDYYASYEDKAFRGNIKNAASFLFTWFNSFDNEAFRGKLKSVGATALTYYSSFDDKAFRGKIKSIDRQLFEYYSSYDRREYSGALKTGYRILYFNGIKYLVLN